MTKLRLQLFLSALIVSLSVCSQVTMERLEQGVLIKEGNSKVLFYQVDPKAKNGQFARNNYIHPLWGLDGRILTEDFPEDHLHQRGIFWAWHQILIDGQRVGDGWELKNFEQDVNEIEFFVNSKEQGVFKTEVLWRSDIWRNKIPYLKEKSQITIHPKQGKIRRIDFEISLQALVEGVSIGGSEDSKGYGGFSTRVILPEDVKFFGSNGKISPEINAVDAGAYINLTGGFLNNNKPGGMIIICNSENPSFPNTWILREKESMQNAKWPGSKPVEIRTSKPTVLKYTLLIYKGKLNENRIKKYLNGSIL